MIVIGGDENPIERVRLEKETAQNDDFYFAKNVVSASIKQLFQPLLTE